MLHVVKTLTLAAHARMRAYGARTALVVWREGLNTFIAGASGPWLVFRLLIVYVLPRRWQKVRT